MRPKLTYSNVIATLALFVALGGTSYAAVVITGKNVKDNSLTTKDIKDASLLKRDFKPGQLPSGAKGTAGAQGIQGTTGAQGTTGQQGSPAASTFTSRFINNTGLTQLLYGPVSGIGPIANTDEDAVSESSPAVPIVARDLFAEYANDSSLPGGTRAFTLRVNGADTALTCTLTRPAASCSNTTDAVAIPAGSLLAIKFFQAGAEIGSGTVIVAFRGTTP